MVGILAGMTGDGTGRLAAATRAGLAAAMAVARAQGLPAADPRVLSARGNLLVHLAPAPVVARVATLTGWTRRDPAAWLAREVAVAGFAAGQGGPVVAPTGLADPGPHHSHGLPLTLWTYLPPTPERPSPAETGQALADLHLALAGFPGQLPLLSPATDQISDGLAALAREQALSPAGLAALRDRHAAILAGLDGPGSPPIVLHGDAHPGNLLPAGGHWLWTDMEETCHGPREWDLAVLARQSGPGAPEALAAYASATGTPVPDPETLAPFTRARLLEAAVWSLGMAHQYPARYTGVARDLLTQVLTAPCEPPPAAAPGTRGQVRRPGSAAASGPPGGQPGSAGPRCGRGCR